MNPIPHLRIARPVSDLERTRRMYGDGLGLRLIGSFDNHDGFDGRMLGAAGAHYHFEFTHSRAHPVPPAPTVEDLVVLYFPARAQWQAACDRMEAAGFSRVESLNPYWEATARTYVDADGYRIVLQQAAWTAESFGRLARPIGMKKLLLAVSHLVVLVAGFALGVYTLPIIVAPHAPSAAEVAAQASQATFKGQFRRDLRGSDALHWGEGAVSVSRASIALAGKLAPGPDYKLYLSPELVETEADFKRLKPSMIRVGDVKTFKNFLVPLPAGVDPARYRSVVVWCETFSKFITAANYQ